MPGIIPVAMPIIMPVIIPIMPGRSSRHRQK
jgi:hypothetical protein